MEYDSLSRCLGGEMVNTRDSKSRAKERGAELDRIGIPIRSRALGIGIISAADREILVIFYRINGESALKIVRPAPNPRVYASTGITQGDFGTGRSQNGDYRERICRVPAYSKKALFFGRAISCLHCMVPLCKNPESFSLKLILLFIINDPLAPGNDLDQ
ncbi:hypothetical protein HAX54_043426 [Datura stramonium]|uniref:Uncharacterized protein n=1 Tax=Datura stramonium TaxID=4076 RepID=A0ABS8SNB5_DATST|nr:hypothetical protein [Datura stramonium]